ncbi:UNVERIFIED_CONTAM: Succinate dehydrogenase assembly factor 2, mitochondrial [Sesamum latifolium]|uniref:Succinate dehydrogenase assembly factor 2, mitochondrial n=1 Tax=Sesamum latifolium TaxID=2727402 RepID=A0AAW2UDQ9_9LAMI
MASMRRALFSTVTRIISSNRISPTSPQSLHRPILGSFARFYCANESAQPLDIDLSNEESKRRLFNRLLYRSKQRGYLELDLIMGNGWRITFILWMKLESSPLSMSLTWVGDDVADLENPDLWKWLTGQEQPPEAVNANPVFTSVKERVTNNLDNHAAPETRATPGQSWVRGWDDFKRGRDGPIAGNQ